MRVSKHIHINTGFSVEIGQKEGRKEGGVV